MNNKNIAGPYIRKARLRKSMTQAQLAKSMKKKGFPMTRHIISNIECGRRAVYSHELLGFSQCLNVSAQDLIDWP